jgi:hypothetical protein
MREFAAGHQAAHGQILDKAGALPHNVLSMQG